MPDRLSPRAAVAQLENFWRLPSGYFYRLRQGDYDRSGAEQIEAVLRAISVTAEAQLPRRLVALTWMIPTFMEWQLERVEEAGGDVEALKADIVKLRNALEQLLGVP